MMNKKVLIILGGILVLIVLVGVVLASVLSKSKNSKTPTTNPPTTNPNPTPTPTPTPTPNPTNKPSAPTKITNEQATSPILSLTGGEVWYFSPSGSLEELNLTTANLKKFILPKNLQVDSAIWAPQNSDFIVVTNNSDGTKTYNYYSSSKSLFTQYPANVKDVEFMPSGTQVVFIWQNSNGTSALKIADPDLSNYKTLIATMPEPHDTIAISPLGSAVLAYDTWSAKNGKLYFITMNDLKLSTIQTNATNSALWSNDGTHFVYNPYNASDATDTTLWLGSVKKTDALTSLGINIPISKLAFNLNGTTLFYAAPESGQTSDSFWEYSISDGKKTEIYSGNSYNLNVSNILVTNDGNSLYFKNTNDGFIYTIPTTGTVSTSTNTSTNTSNNTSTDNSTNTPTGTSK